MTPQTDHTPEDIATAGEYVLRLLSAQDEAVFTRRLREEPFLRALVAEWEEALIPLADEIADAAPPRRVLARIEARIFEAGNTRRSGRKWFGWPTALISMGVAAAIAALVIFNPVATQAPTHRAQIEAEDRSLIIEANYDSTAGMLDVARISGEPPSGRVLELWLIEKGAPAPVSLGVLEDARTRVTVPESLRPALEAGVLAVSDEPPGGSPTGTPTGTVLAVGPVVQL